MLGALLLLRSSSVRRSASTSWRIAHRSATRTPIPVADPSVGYDAKHRYWRRRLTRGVFPERRRREDVVISVAVACGTKSDQSINGAQPLVRPNGNVVASPRWPVIPRLVGTASPLCGRATAGRASAPSTPSVHVLALAGAPSSGRFTEAIFASRLPAS